ncbi:MAG: archease [Planctomycetia bacterium]|nr:archease [Planctomycetia bacterium]
MYDIFEHTADLGIRFSATTLEQAMADAGRGLFAVIAGDLGQIRPVAEEAFVVAGTDPTWLLFDWVSELHAAFELRRMLFATFTVECDATGLRATARGERYDPARHTLAHEIKAITQHELDLRRTAEGWEGRFIVDI